MANYEDLKIMLKDNDPTAKTSVPDKCSRVYFNITCNRPVCRNNNGTWSKMCQQHKDVYNGYSARRYAKKRQQKTSELFVEVGDIEDGEIDESKLEVGFGVCTDCEGPTPRLKHGSGYRKQCVDCQVATGEIFAAIKEYKKKRRVVETFEDRSVRPKLEQERIQLRNRLAEIELELQLEEQAAQDAAEEYEIAKSKLLSIV
jgi:hypothetical protein